MFVVYDPHLDDGEPVYVYDCSDLVGCIEQSCIDVFN